MDFSLITNWLGREGGDVLSWWLLATLAGAAAWPLLYRMAGGLPDRGYTLARPAGLILTGFLFWYLGSLGMLRNTIGGMIFAWVVVLLVGLVIFFRWPDRPPVRDWLTENTPLIIATEVLFLLMLVLWAAYRAHNPELGSTEKPMEMAFLNGIRRSATFPPNDPWLAGYSISYYYFGYVIAAMLADLSGVSSGVAFNLMIALLFALTGTAALGVVYNLVRSRWTIGRKMKRGQPGRGARRGTARRDHARLDGQPRHGADRIPLAGLRAADRQRKVLRLLGCRGADQHGSGSTAERPCSLAEAGRRQG